MRRDEDEEGQDRVPTVDALVDWALKQDLDADRIRREAWPEHGSTEHGEAANG